MIRYQQAMHKIAFSADLEQRIRDRLIARGVQPLALSAASPRPVGRRVGLAACAVVALVSLVLGYAVWYRPDYGSLPPVSQAQDSEVDSSHFPVVDGADVTRTDSASCYATPQPGQWFCFESVRRAREAYRGQDVVFYVAIDIFAADHALEGKELAEETARLQSLGYEVGLANTWTYEGAGKKVESSFLGGYFTEDQWAKFQPDKRYGYAFRFAYNGDGSPVSGEDNRAVVRNSQGQGD